MKKALVFVFITIFSNPTFSQKYEEVGLFFGGTYFMGDVHSSISKNTHLSYGINYRKNFNSRWALSFLLRQAKISGEDVYSEMAFEQQRNLSFQSNVADLSALVEFNFLDFEPYAPQSFFQLADVFTPYLGIGISLIRFNPKAYLSGNLYELQPLQTEGVEYAKVTVAFPIQLGFKFRLSDRMLLQIAGELRITASDYLDDVSTRYPTDPDLLSKTSLDMSNRSLEGQGLGGDSWGAQRGNEYDNDWFSYLGFTLSYNLRKNPGSCHFNTRK